ncbi:precorrin-2 dehydrogenase / sirohydrochlorin ferrochelatase [Chitinophaga terrae (ex Kim and Jung 2007)]|jgi:siroheme synthase-like protein|uniref:precorrin-2 dehydrogenase n=1 Tax=Chitinophaga terrae (ex Kim and Jung 2007) TaxID=408074 RepID=A0A1H4E6F9_9BACT|nr:bifunctional precorrin-2 dehydrogenase/sirohydrochlorin ferrochelatase [Chitinophaga terrae (ex Kim and Jung 2007)]MDQ0108327.1 siroheme synthase-like protein [Chitinophaga terrae (ex Kim and Jung 2007)]GEP91370.1 precorrin-2 oxidase [Chitinophaga terrae (ex Kim and Jung 2007)]SEA80417.1 precorrin-2 dehydrogenase / sirohydrochlorin ferrochelatase [Chitinophaga terrae (ex Kim and Jung 2007)]
MEENHLFPVFFKLQRLHVLVVGGGNIGLEKTNAMLENCPQATITVVALDFLPELEALTHQYPNITLVQKSFSCGDLLGKDLVIAATNIKEFNYYVWEKAKGSRVLINVADTPDLCDFYLGSIVRKGNLKIAISTNGKSPTIAKRLKQVLQEAIPDSIDEILHKLSAIRDRLAGDFASKVKQLNNITDVLVQTDKDKS